jgi:predicted ATPase/class 3 adenylate cyclase/predicted negative regulator of RcsB-dependent stress response
MSSLPTGTVTFLFTDIEGSTSLLRELSDRYADALADYRRLLRDAFLARDGHEVDTQGDAFFVAFPRARDAIVAAIAAQRAVLTHAWPGGAGLRVRMGLHTGEPLTADTGYVGMDVHRAARICAAGHGGQILLSEATRILVEEELPEGVSLRDLGEHRLKDLARPQALSQVVVADLPVDFPPLKSLNALPNNLPTQLTTFVGREHEIAEVKELLSKTRLVTLTGSGGAGKTRLSLQVAAEVLADFEDGVWLVELAPLSDPDLVAQTVASAVNVREQPNRPVLTTLCESLQRKHLLLVLDNCEHLVAACARVSDTLLRACPNLRILATSREALGIAGETSWRVPSLSLPDPRHLPDLERLSAYEAVRLFIDRAVAVLPTFTVTNENAPWIAQVCHRLDGIPLAVELAAVRVKGLSVEQIATRLDDRFRLLTGGSRVGLPHHQTLRAAMDWSYDMLSEPERIVLRRLAVFAAGFTLEAAEAVAGGDGVDASEVLDLLIHLVDKSLVVAEEQGGEARYRLLETVQQYGRERLRESGEAEAAQRRHRDWYLGLAERVEPKLFGAEQAAWFDRLEVEQGNLRAALMWSIGSGGTEAALRLVGILWRFWAVRGYFEEGSGWLEAVLEVAEKSNDAPAAFRAKALNAAGFLALSRGGIATARSLLEESLAIQRQLGDKAGIATSLSNLGTAAIHQGDIAMARALLEEGLAIRRELGDKVDIVGSLNDLGAATIEQGDIASAHALLEEGLAIRRELGDKAGIAASLNNLSIVAIQRGAYAAARSFLEESLRLCQEVGDRWLNAVALDTLGDLTRTQGDHAAARALYEESLAISRQLDDQRGVAYCLEGLAAVARAQGQHDRAAQLFAAAEALRETSGDLLRMFERADHDRDVAAVHAGLGDEKFISAWAQGRAMGKERAIEYALAPGTN